ncbi:MAG TPA: dihydrofolate reductase family protein [Gemmatimonadales bacterium]|nr:dihydrofolate reductase family protein [Gemmatimonadales bacterium]
MNRQALRRVRYSVAMSLDGYIADPDGGYDWIPVDPDIDFGALFRDVDTVLVGRKSWEIARRQPGGGGMPPLPTYVFSRTLRPADVPGAVLSRDPAQTVAELKRQPGKNIWLFGGGELFRSLLAHDLVDEVEIGLVPVLLGRGLPMLPGADRLARLELLGHRVYAATGTVLLRYQIVRAGAGVKPGARARRSSRRGGERRSRG